MNDQLLLLVRVLQHDLGAVHVGLDRVHRLLDDQLHADGGGKMEDDVAPVDHLGEQRLVGHRVDRRTRSRACPSDARCCRSSRWTGCRGPPPRGRRCEQAFGEVRSDEPGASGDQGFHAVRCPFRNAPTVVGDASRRLRPPGAGWSGSDSSSRGGGGGDRDTRARLNAANAGCVGSGTG